MPIRIKPTILFIAASGNCLKKQISVIAIEKKSWILSPVNDRYFSYPVDNRIIQNMKSTTAVSLVVDSRIMAFF